MQSIFERIRSSSASFATLSILCGLLVVRSASAETEVPKAEVKSPSPAASTAPKSHKNKKTSKKEEAPNPEADNTETNKRDRGERAVTAGDQDNGERDLGMTVKIRKAVVADKSLSTNGHNVKIIARDGHVTLRGPVASAVERAEIGRQAEAVAGVGHVTNDLEVAR